MFSSKLLKIIPYNIPHEVPILVFFGRDFVVVLVCFLNEELQNRLGKMEDKNKERGLTI